MEKGNTVGEQEKKEIAFSNRDLRRLIVPLLIEQMLNCTVGLLDSLMVSTVGEAAVSAVFSDLSAAAEDALSPADGKRMPKFQKGACAAARE